MRDDWNEAAADLSRDERARLEDALRCYTVPPAPAAAREAAVSAALKALARRPRSRWEGLVEQIRVEARFLPMWYYLLSGVIAVAGAALLLTQPQEASRLGLLVGLVPMPALLGLLEVFHGEDEGMAEIEAACRYSRARVLSARMLIIGFVSCVIAAALGMVTRTGSPWVSAGLVVIPYCGSAAAGLLLSTWMQGRAGAGQVALAVATVDAMAALVTAGALPRLMHVPSPVWLLAMVLSVLLLTLGLRGTLADAEHKYLRRTAPWN